MSENWISFPNLGIEFNLNPIAFTLGSLEVKWSLIFTLIAAAVAFYLYFKAVSKQNLGRAQVSVVTAVTVFFGFVGARLVFVIPENLWLMDQFYQLSGNYPDEGYFNTFYKFIAFFDKNYDGLNLFGGLVFGFIALAVLCRIKKWPMAKYLDSIIYALPASVAINALGYITNQSSFGRHSNALLAVNGNLIEEQVYSLYQASVLRGEASIGPKVLWHSGDPVAPTPIYLMLGCIAVMLTVYLISKFMFFTGEKFLWSFGLFSLVSAFIESMRVDSPLFWNMRINVLISVSAVLICAVLIVIFRWQVREGRLRRISQYVDPRKNNGFEKEVFVQKVYRGEAADIDTDKTTHVAPGEAADIDTDKTTHVAPGEGNDIVPNEPSDIAPGDIAPSEADIDTDKTTHVAPGEGNDIVPNEPGNVAPGDIAPSEAADIDTDQTKAVAPGEAKDIITDIEPSGGKGQVWTADDFADEETDRSAENDDKSNHE